jgi:hypothetical protein
LTSWRARRSGSRRLGKPVYLGERGGKVVIEWRLDGTMAIRLGGQYLSWQEIAPAVGSSGALPARAARV